MPGGAGTDLRAIGAAAGHQRSGAGPNPRNRCGKRSGKAGCRRSAPPSVSQDVPDFLASPKDPSFRKENECLEKKGAGCGHQRLGNSCSGGNVGGFGRLARVKRNPRETLITSFEADTGYSPRLDIRKPRIPRYLRYPRCEEFRNESVIGCKSESCEKCLFAGVIFMGVLV